MRKRQARRRRGAASVKELAKIVDLLNSIDGRLAAIQTSVFDVDEINALLREVLKELKKTKSTDS
jgi:hypothetical protein